MQTAANCSRLFHFSRTLLNGAYKRNVSSLHNETNLSLKKGKNTETASNSVEASCFRKPKLISGISGIPKDIGSVGRSSCQFGDDSCFTASHTKADVIGVADGVGGWHEYGVDPGAFSDALMRACERLVLAGAFSPSQPDRLLSAAYRQLLDHKQPVLGSTTACLLVLARDAGRLYAANIGDSGFMLVRGGRVLARSEEQQHYFNTPYQLSNAPPGQHGQVLCDQPECAHASEYAVQAGDVILLGSDGVFDNLTDAMLVQELSGLCHCGDGATIQRAANTIALMARRLAADQAFMSPFAQNARAHGFDATGGKPDDITVVLATVICS